MIKSFRQNGEPLVITRTKLEHQRRQIINARKRAERKRLHGAAK